MSALCAATSLTIPGFLRDVWSAFEKGRDAARQSPSQLRDSVYGLPVWPRRDPIFDALESILGDDPSTSAVFAHFRELPRDARAQVNIATHDGMANVVAALRDLGSPLPDHVEDVSTCYFCGDPGSGPDMIRCSAPVSYTHLTLPTILLV